MKMESFHGKRKRSSSDSSISESDESGRRLRQRHCSKSSETSVTSSQERSSSSPSLLNKNADSEKENKRVRIVSTRRQPMKVRRSSGCSSRRFSKSHRQRRICSIVTVPQHSTILSLDQSDIPTVSTKILPTGSRFQDEGKSYRETLERNNVTCTNGINEKDEDCSDGDVFESDSCHRNSRRKSEPSLGCCRPLINYQTLTPSTPSSTYRRPSHPTCSPYCTSPLTPRSALKGLDQAHPWAVDFVRRSQTYRYSFIDSHCHIDLLYDRLGVSHHTPFHEFRRMVGQSFPANFEGCMAVFCYPRTYDSLHTQDTLCQTLGQDNDVWLVFGCHPKSATEFSSRHEQGLRQALSRFRAVALGEIGLDYSGTFHQHAETQKKILKLQIQIALEHKLPLVVHCRDASDDCLTIMRQHVPQSWRIHLHCFCGNIQEAERWMDAFPNLFIGFTPVITYRSARDPVAVARVIPLSRLLLETDSPYFVPGSIREGRVQVSHSGFALFTAEKIAEVRDVPVDEVLLACRNNTRLMYGI